jgi:hypothetical protein
MGGIADQLVAPATIAVCGSPAPRGQCVLDGSSISLFPVAIPHPNLEFVTIIADEPDTGADTSKRFNANELFNSSDGANINFKYDGSTLSSATW